MKWNRHGRIKQFLPTILFAWPMLFSHAAADDARLIKPTVAVLTPGQTYEPAFVGLREGLEKLGYRENRDIQFMVEDTQGSLDRLAERAARLVAAKPAVLFTVATAPSTVARQVTQVLPIVFTLVGDPVQTGLVAGFGSSKNNVTGVVTFSAQLSGKRLQVLKEIAPRAKKVLSIVSVTEPIGLLSFKFLEAGARKFGLQIVRKDISSKDEHEELLKQPWAGKVDAVLSLPSVLVNSVMQAVVEKTKKERLPLMSFHHTHTELGALASYSGDFRELGVQAGKLVGKILNGARPADLPIETPDQLFLSINIATAKSIGIDVPRKVLNRADRLLE